MTATIHRLRTWRGMVVAAAAGAVLTVALVGWAASQAAKSSPPQVTAWLVVEPPSTVPGAVQGDCRSQLASFRQTQAHLIVSPNVLEAAAKDPQVRRLVAGRADPVAWLQAGIKVEDLSDDLLTVSMPGEARADQAIIVNAVVDAYLEATADWEQGQRLSRTVAGRPALASYRATLFEKRNALHATPPPEPAQAAALRDEIAVLEEVAHRLGVAEELSRLGSTAEPTMKLVARARP